MSSHPILLAGGAGIVGRRAARYLREACPDVPLLIGGRDRVRAERAAAEIGGAQGVALDPAAEDLGLGAQPVAGVAVLYADESLSCLRFAQSRGIAHVSIAPLLNEIAPEVAAFMFRPQAAPVILATEWLVGATSLPTLAFSRAFGRIDGIRIGAVLDDEDVGGPAQAVDLERVTKTAPAALARCAGRFVWRAGADAQGRVISLDGTEMVASALSPNDVPALAMATGARTVSFDLATGVSSSRRRGGAMSCEILVDMTGRDRDGHALRSRHAIIHPRGQFPLTGLGVAMVLERAIGLDGKAPLAPGLYFPSQILDPSAYLARLEGIGGRVETLEWETAEAPALPHPA